MKYFKLFLAIKEKSLCHKSYKNNTDSYKTFTYNVSVVSLYDWNVAVTVGVYFSKKYYIYHAIW